MPTRWFTQSRGRPHGCSVFDAISSKYHRVTLNRASFSIVGESVRVQSSVPTMLRRSDVKSPTGRAVLPHTAGSSELVSTGTK